MEFLGIGAPELIFILIIALILLGPKDMQKTGKTIGKWLNNLVRSDGWRVFQRTSRELRNLPTNLMRQANLEMMDVERELRKPIEPRTAGAQPPVPAAPTPTASTIPTTPLPGETANSQPDPVKPPAG